MNFPQGAFKKGVKLLDGQGTTKSPMSEWKIAKEAFVAQHEGGGLIELCALLCVVPLFLGVRLRLRPERVSLALALDIALVVAPPRLSRTRA